MFVIWFVVVVGWLFVLFLVYWRILGVKWWWWRWWFIMILMFVRKFYLLYRNLWFIIGEFWDDLFFWLFFLLMWLIFEVLNNGKCIRIEVLFCSLIGKNFCWRFCYWFKKKKIIKIKLNKKMLWYEGEVCVSG